MTYDFWEYMFKVGVALEDFTHSEEYIISKHDFFDSAYKRGISPHLALTELMCEIKDSGLPDKEVVVTGCEEGLYFEECEKWLKTGEGCIDCESFKGIKYDS